MSRQLLSQHKHCQTGFFFVRNFFQAGGQSTKCIYNILILLLSSPTKSFWESDVVWTAWKDQSQTTTTTTKIVFYAWNHPTDDILLNFYGIRWLEKIFQIKLSRGEKMGKIFFYIILIEKQKITLTILIKTSCSKTQKKTPPKLIDRFT